MKILTVVGARPQFIKSAPVSQALRAVGMSEIIVHTGQHYDPSMSAVFFDELGLTPPARNLGVGSGRHGDQTGRMLKALEDVLLDERPNWVMVYGDTNSTLAGALAAAKMHIPIAHVEAGLRSFNRRMAEEINRVVADHLSRLLFAPSSDAVRNLAAEGIVPPAVHLVGDVMLDAVQMFGALAQEKSPIIHLLKLEARNYVLATIHRAENTDDPHILNVIFHGLIDLSREWRVVMPLHPRTRNVLDEDLKTSFAATGGVLINPVGYLDMLMLERQARLIVTDSGGVQKEAFFHGVPCVTLRDETEWTELIALGWNILLQPSRADQLREIAVAQAVKKRIQASPYGHGQAALAIATCLARASSIVS